MLVGRDREIVAIDAAIERARGGQRSAIMLTGEAGIGKSTLLDELASRTVSAGGVVAWGRSAEVGLTPAFWPWIQILAALAPDDDDARELLDRIDETGTVAGSAARLARFERVVGLVRQRARAAPLTTLLFDDAHVADLGSLQLLEYVLPRLAGGIVIGVAARDGDASPAVAQALGRIRRAARRLPLSRLDREAVGHLVGERVAPAVMDKVWELTEGNPLFVEELVESLADGGPPQLPAVSSVRAIVHDRIARMAPETGQLLAVAALVGREFRIAVVADILEVSVADASARLDPVLRSGMVLAMTGDRYRFSHALIAEALGDELDPSERAGVHLRAAQAIERHDGDTGDTSAAIAHHLLAAGHLAAEAAVAAAEHAAERAIARLGYEDAAALLERAVSALALAAPGDLAHRFELECRWAEALQLAGEHARAAERCESAAHLARELGDVHALARIAIVRGLEYRFGRTDPLLIAVLRDALAALGNAPPETPPSERDVLRAKLLARLAAAEQPAIDPQEPTVRAKQAIELAAGLSDRDRLAVMYSATAALVDYIRAEELEVVHREVLALATALEDRVAIVHTLVRMCFTALERADRAAFEQHLAELRLHAIALGIPRWIRTLHLIDALRSQLDGRFAEADHHADAAEEVAGNDASGRWLVDIHRLMSTNQRTTSPGPELRELALGYEPTPGVFAVWMAYIEDDTEAMRTTIAVHGPLPRDVDLALFVAPAVCRVGTPELRESLYERGQVRRGRVMVGSMMGTTILDLQDRLLMLLAASLERWDDVEALGASALAIAERLGSLPWAARVRSDLADCLERRGRPADAAGIAELRSSALADAERIGMPGLIAHCRTVSPAQEPPPATTAPDTRTTDRGVELERSGALWIVRGFGEQAHVKDSRGVQMLARLVASPGVEIHALELSGAGGAVDGGDAGEVLDATARARYRERLRELDAERDEAEAWGDAARLERAMVEIEALTSELERAVGMGGRERRIGSASERARSNVQRRLNHALHQIRAACPRLGEHLAATVRTGTYCHYDP